MLTRTSKHLLKTHWRKKDLTEPGDLRFGQVELVVVVSSVAGYGHCLVADYSLWLLDVRDDDRREAQRHAVAEQQDVLGGSRQDLRTTITAVSVLHCWPIVRISCMNVPESWAKR